MVVKEGQPYWLAQTDMMNPGQRGREFFGLIYLLENYSLKQWQALTILGQELIGLSENTHLGEPTSYRLVARLATEIQIGPDLGNKAFKAVEQTVNKFIPAEIGDADKQKAVFAVTTVALMVLGYDALNKKMTDDLIAKLPSKTCQMVTMDWLQLMGDKEFTSMWQTDD